MVLNIGLNWALIYGNLGAPAMGVRGDAFASTIASAIALFALFACFLARVGRGATGAWGRSAACPLRYGPPSGLNWFFEFAAFIFLVNVVVAGFGTTSLAALMGVMQINTIAFMPTFGVASAGAILVGQTIGRREHDLVPRTVRLTLSTAATWQGFVGASYFIAPALLLSPFADPDADTSDFLDVGARMLMLSVRLLGGGDVVAVLWIVAYIAALAVALLLRFRSGAWRRLDLAGDAIPELDEPR
jgi:MATE family multidrug resistance protein